MRHDEDRGRLDPDALGALDDALPEALAAASPHRPPPELRARLLRRAAEPAWRAWLRPWTLGAAALLLVLAGALAWGVGLAQALAQERALLMSLVGQQEVVLEVVDSPTAVRRFLKAQQPGSTAYGKVFTRPDLPHVVTMAGRLPRPPEGQAYHLWLTSRDETRLAGVLAVTETGFGILIFDADRVGPTYEVARLTLQSKGSDAPAGTTVLLWEGTR